MKKIENSNYWITQEGRVWSEVNGGKFLKHVLNRGYPRIGLKINGKRRYMLLHRLVAIYFLENPNNYEQVNHKNGIKTDNRLENLEWCSGSMNVQHSYALGLTTTQKGEKRPMSKLTENQVLEIRRLKEEAKLTNIELGKMFNVSDSAINLIIKRINWKYLK